MKAFPSRKDYDSYGKLIDCNGMDLRDYFAGQVIAGMASLDPQTLWNAFSDRKASLSEAMAETAYTMADAMIKERENKK